MNTRSAVLVGSMIGMLVVGAGEARGQFVNWETPHVAPVDMTPDGAKLLVTNTADNRLEIFAVGDGGLAAIGAVPVGMEPVSVRARTNDEAWVVNQMSDTVTIVDLGTLAVKQTLQVGDEPADVVFAGKPLKAFVSMSQDNEIWVYDAAAPADPLAVIGVEGEDPRALATDGQTVYAAIFESGTDTTIIAHESVSTGVNPYPGNPNPPPNDGASFTPAIADDLPTAPEVAMIVKRQPGGTWLDDNAADWSAAVTWDLHGHDVAIIDANTLAAGYTNSLMNANMALAAAPGGAVAVVGLDAINEIRFEPNLNGIFVRVVGAHLSPGGAVQSIVDLNPHLDYSVPTVDQATRDLSIGDPRGVAWSADGTALFVTGLGSNNLVAFDASFARTGLVEVGEGPTGVVFDAARDLLYVLNRFEATISRVDADGLVELDRTSFYDATPSVVRDGRPFLYDTHLTSGLGQASCASCHIDGRMDQLAWDLGDPSGEMKDFNQVCNFGLGGCEDWHPMKGPMMTQTLQGILEAGPMHWRADREDLAAFNGAFVGLMGREAELTGEQMQAFEDFVGTITYTPNPFRGVDNSLPNELMDGDPNFGRLLFMFDNLDGGTTDCVTCHALPTGTNGELTSADLILDTQSMKVAQMRNMFEKTGFDHDSQSNNRGFGYTHDGAVDSLMDFLLFPAFTFPPGEAGQQERRDVTAFLFAFGDTTHAGIGAQATLGGPGPDQTPMRDALVTAASDPAVDLIAKAVIDDEARGYLWQGDASFASDRAAEDVTLADLDAAAGAGSVVTYTLVAATTATRLGIDRDLDGFLDRDEIDACADPADPASTPDNSDCGTPGDVNGDGIVDVQDLTAVIIAWGDCPPDPEECPADLTGDGEVNVQDLVQVVVNWS